MRDIQKVLQRWGSWAAGDGGHLGYASLAAGFKGLLVNSSKSRSRCCDDDGLIVSSAMNCLKKRNAYLCTLLEMHYIKAMSVRLMGKKLGVSHNQVATRLQSAEGFIDGCLAVLDIKLEMDKYCQKEKILEIPLKKVV
ncbi:antitermination protein [Izhakiella australiensis]|uniref:Antitermination protein n=1 Tax=Izhakiella australiensis TaxID=1926881 RepID=A0A1S8YLM9_9GAMM|nr:antiterminator Q family protein [Izhakiella australiensis]OON39767.1 antitermination protein [Izhakiella australiensis]